MGNQKCIVTNKNQLIAAVGCAIDFYGTTKIILNRKNGISFINLRPQDNDLTIKFDNFGYFERINSEYNKYLRKFIARIRKTPANCFR